MFHPGRPMSMKRQHATFLGSLTVEIQNKLTCDSPKLRASTKEKVLMCTLFYSADDFSAFHFSKSCSARHVNCVV
uniref:Anaphase-promoting complex subunit 11 n=1 Tax=Rhizophora mucronata TaxID=61149 RepID=A0A2P2KII4_RHIMU